MIIVFSRHHVGPGRVWSSAGLWTEYMSRLLSFLGIMSTLGVFGAALVYGLSTCHDYRLF